MFVSQDQRDEFVICSKFDEAIDKEATLKKEVVVEAGETATHEDIASKLLDKDEEVEETCLDRYLETYDPADLKAVEGKVITKFIFRPTSFKVRRDVNRKHAALQAGAIEERLDKLKEQLDASLEEGSKLSPVRVQNAIVACEKDLAAAAVIDSDIHVDVSELMFRGGLFRIEGPSPLHPELEKILKDGRVDGLLPVKVLEFFIPDAAMELGGRHSAIALTGKKKIST